MNPRTLAAAAAAFALVLPLAACSSGPSAACRKAQAHEFAVVNSDQGTVDAYAAAGGTIVGTPQGAKVLHDETSAVAAMKAAGCPSGTKYSQINWGG